MKCFLLVVTPDAWFVVYVTEWGFFAWNVACMVNKGNRLVNMKVQEGEKK